MTIEIILAAIIAALPTISAIAGIIFAVIKCIRAGRTNGKELIDKFDEMRTEVLNTREYEELKILYKDSVTQYRNLMKAHRELLTKIDRIVRKEEDYEGKQTNEIV